mmetsp:Transcript_30954/g.84698  ORF Transcript_30954/g.84698 Transcript_30954/m.84698 type:complete len:141 (+) Transcript_30954:78-500(+)|eukprot:5905032-Prymnesium_polylepis.1
MGKISLERLGQRVLERSWAPPLDWAEVPEQESTPPDDKSWVRHSPGLKELSERSKQEARRQRQSVHVAMAVHNHLCSAVTVGEASSPTRAGVRVRSRHQDAESAMTSRFRQRFERSERGLPRWVLLHYSGRVRCAPVVPM